jgi:hypothetical protein
MCTRGPAQTSLVCWRTAPYLIIPGSNFQWGLNVCLAFPFRPSLHFMLFFAGYGCTTLLYAIFEPRLYLDIPFYFSAYSSALER